jgi:hypothetical protein
LEECVRLDLFVVVDDGDLLICDIRSIAKGKFADSN